MTLAVVLAACGGTAASTDEGVASISGDSSTTTVAELSAEDAAQAFTACMREQGVEMEDPTVDADGNVTPGRPTNLPDPGQGGQGEGFGEEMRTAFEACGDLLGDTGFGFTQQDQTELQDQLLALADCLRDQGLDVADPDLSNLGGPGRGGEGGQGGGPFGIDFQDPDVQAALEACSDVVPNLGRGPGGGPGQAPANDN